ncbi:uncharacterized protein [Halyomorpha halys]|uniref:uncharacterized protein n=1 Tax=Halyomorpha halys TaxID=286706 RepID=UPI0006D4C80F
MPAEDIIVAFKQIASKPQHYEEALSYFINNYYQIKPKLVEDEKAELIRYLGALGSTDEHISIFGNFTFKNASSNVIVKAVQDAVKSAQTNKQFMSNHYEDIYNGLNGVIPPSTLSPSTITPTNPTITPPSSTPSPSGASFSAVAFPTLLMISGLILRYLN